MAAPAAVFLLSFALRIAYIGHESVGYNEAITLTVSQLPRSEIIRALVADFFHPPLHVLLLRGWFKLFGFGVLQARLLSALFSTLAVVLVYFFAKYLFDRTTALVSSLLMAVSQLAIWFAQEPRPFAQLSFFVLLSSYLFVRAVRERHALYWWAFVGASVLTMYTDYFGAFAIAALALYAVIYRKRYRLPLSWLVAGAGIAFVLYLPWIASGIVREATHNPQTFGGRQSYMAVHWFTFVTAMNSFNNGRLAGLEGSSPWWTLLIGGILFGVPVAIALKKLGGGTQTSSAERLDHEGLVVTTLLWLLPLCAVIGLGFTLHVQYKIRYVLFCAAPYYMLVGYGISRLRSKTLRWMLVAFIMAYSVNSLRTVYFQQWKENFRDAFAYVQTNLREGDCGVFLPGFDVPYQWTISQAGQPSFRVIPRGSLAAGLIDCPRIWAIAGANSENQFSWAQAAVDGQPLEMADSMIEQRRYYGVRVSLYSRREK